MKQNWWSGDESYEEAVFQAHPVERRLSLGVGEIRPRKEHIHIAYVTEKEIAFINRRLNYPRNLYKGIFDYIWNAKSLMTIFALQDLLKLDDHARINYPGTIGEPNWCWKLKDMSWTKKVKFGQ